MAKPGSTPSRDRRLPPRNNVNANTSPNRAALQGALLAFNHATPPRSHSPLNMAGRPPVSLLDSDPDPLPELPGPGTIKDRIALFSSPPATLEPNNRPKSAAGSVPDITRQKTPQLLAAEIAAGSSNGPNSKTTGVDAQRAQLQRIGKALPSPIPVRKPVASSRILDPYFDDHQEHSPPKPYVGQRSVSPKPSTSPRPPITKPRPVPPPVPRKPSPAFSEPLSFDRRHENRNRFESPSGPIPLRSKTSASTLPEERPPALPPRRAATVATNDANEPHVNLGRDRSPAFPSTPSAMSLYSQSQNHSSTSILNNLTDVSRDGTSDAVAASSLASNRALQTRRPSPPPPPPSRRRRSRSRSILGLHHQHKRDRTADPSPGGLRGTLRTQPKSDDEDERNRRQHRNHLIRKHPHKHQEGDRKRWRSEITEKERKRYEGVWAANKGLLIPPDQVADKKATEHGIPPGMYPPAALEMVVNLVVQDIWSRSRLPDHVLERVWDLVDEQKIGLLTRAEFVVGTWLIDQQLRGHKLPVVVPDSVWASVTRVPGISL
ncbi:hypothetical protein ASPSYDRAFT_54918 [Aspergillus sydowii CBS 593.65]|uniref:EH domain-containing protein n=1 Tax=Aspergillus sydowii CBS 593.65 TaxID=1036612 RepID=A0A1L9TRA3_9EURO|nr:uncharacterized protein ASPSYDRAFT_54918 [Aspergillus sydowii CBS 593.65]OJJ61970.1 hypothetical protein ASPSYDRAFT_54918 [Aspergillus sydowii CBS 593.65]